ncbi:MAG: hypothetical protein QM704_03665 [Anaeromyxobacteraceae bacterium]
MSASDDAELAAVEVSLDLDGARWVGLARSGGAWTGTLALREWAFPAFTRAAVATARATDGAGNQATKAAAGLDVTRLRWAVEAKAGSAAVLSPPAVMTDGTIVVGNANHELLSLTPAGVKAEDPLVIGGGAITSIAVGDKAIWVGSDDGGISAANLDRKSVLSGVGVNVEGPIRGGLAVLPGTVEWAFAGGELGRLSGAPTTGSPAPTAKASYLAAPVITGGNVYAALSNISSTLKQFTFDGALTEGWSVGIGASVSVNPAVASGDVFITLSSDGKVTKTTVAGTSAPVTTVTESVLEAPVVLAGDEIVIGDITGAVRRISFTGASLWSTPPNLGGIPVGALAISNSSTKLLVGTRAGSVYALDNAGATLWTTTLPGAPLLKGSNISAPSAETPITSTAYFSASNGKVYAVIVDGTLDTSAPWPKAFRDRKNRSNAGLAP